MSHDSPEGMTDAQLHEYLWAVYLEHYEPTDRTKHSGYAGWTFEEMVRGFAEDDFYKGHFVAKEYLKSPYAFIPLN